MSSIEFWLPEDEQTPALVQTIGNCGLKDIKEEKIYEFTEDNFFLGLGGVPD